MTRTFASAAFLLLFGSITPVAAQSTATKADDSKSAPSRDPKSESYENFVKELKKSDGQITTYLRKKDVFLELPEDRLGQLILIQATLHSGLDTAFMHAGMPVGGNAVDVFKWVRNEDTVMLVRPNIANRFEKDDPFATGAARTFPEATLATFPIVQQDPARKRLLVNVTSLFGGDLFRLSEMVMGSLGGPYQVERDKSGVESVKGFADSTVVRTKLQYYSPRGSQQNPLMMALGIDEGNTLEDDRSAPLSVTYRLWFRDGKDYVPRLADPRVGYFTESFFSVAKFLAADRTERYINRFDIRKKDPKASISEPTKPIVWTLDPSIPVEYRPAIRDGVLRWNKAFEAIGVKDALKVEEAPTDDSYDHADGRRNVIRLLVGPSAPFSAISLFRTDPLSGQILNASITLDGNAIRDIQEDFARNSAAMKVTTSHALAALTRDPQRSESDEAFIFRTDQERTQLAAANQLRKFGWLHQNCEHGRELKREADLMWFAVAGKAPINRTEYIKRFLTDCVSHEVGHCLGLRHNFAGSTNLTTAQLNDDSITDREGTSASVMDYNPPNVLAVLKGRGNFFAPTIGSYDLWAIRYGYQEFGAKTPLSEKHSLSQVARLSGLPGHSYMSDEDADGSDPFAVRFDGAKDPLNYSERVLTAMDRTISHAVKNLPRPGESYSKRTAVIMNALHRSVREGRNAARFVGGVATSKNFRGDSGERATVVPVSPALQRQAVRLITTHFLAPSSLQLSPQVLKTLSLDENGSSWTAPMRDILGGQKQGLLSLMMSASTTDRITENALKSTAPYGLDEHYRSLMSAVFDEVTSGKNIDPLRRDLQKFAMNGLMAQAGAPTGAINEDVRLVSSGELRQLEKVLAGRLGKSAELDNLTRLHLRESHELVKRFLSRTASAR